MKVLPETISIILVKIKILKMNPKLNKKLLLESSYLCKLIKSKRFAVCGILINKSNMIHKGVSSKILR